MNIYINGTAVISAQNHIQPGAFPEVVSKPEADHFSAQEPSYKEHISPNMIRRMGRAIKMGVSTSLRCLEDAGIKDVDAVICGTGIGCFEDSEKFLLALTDNKETLLTPTSFIQSTHNTVGAQIALLIKCHQYNMTYVHRGLSFESALLDTILMLNERNARNVLAGGIDEMTPGYLTLQRRAGYIKQTPFTGTDLTAEATPGHYMGEGAAFFVLSSQQSASTYALLAGVEVVYQPADTSALETALSAFLSAHQLTREDIGLALLGNSGDVRYEQKMMGLQTGYFKDVPQSNFKHLCGEYMTSSAFALWLASTVLKKGKVPPALTNQVLSDSALRHILIVNHFRDTDYSFMLVSKC